jgi:phospholipid/cholesterol/gamma-HCH transport system substrate-binding protein
MRDRDRGRKLRVGLFTLGLLILLGAAILVLGKKQGFLVRQVHYTCRFAHVAGLVSGAPVWLNGVVVGSVEDVVLPEDPEKRDITASIRVDARVARLIRADSLVRLRSLGLLGDRYLEVTSGSPGKPVIEPGSEIPSEVTPDLASVLAKGGDAVTNVVAVTDSLRRILERVESGKGALGELVMGSSDGQAGAHLASSIAQLDAILTDIRAGKGTIGRLLRDDASSREMVADLAGFAKAGRGAAEALARDLARDDSVVAGLLRDPKGRERLTAALDNAGQAAAAVRDVGVELRDGSGTLPRLLHDRAWAEAFLKDLAGLTVALRSLAEKIDHGKGSAAGFVNDPQLYQDLENVVRGVKNSSVLSGLVRNRRKAGEKVAAEQAAAAVKAAPTPAATVAPPAGRE